VTTRISGLGALWRKCGDVFYPRACFNDDATTGTSHIIQIKETGAVKLLCGSRSTVGCTHGYS